MEIFKAHQSTTQLMLVVTLSYCSMSEMTLLWLSSAQVSVADKLI